MSSKTDSHQSYISLVMIVFSSLLAGSGQLLWKLAIIRADSYIDMFFQLWLYLGISLYIVATLFMLLAFRSGDLSVLFPILATSFVWVAIVASYFFDSEEMTFSRGLGIGFIFFGCCLLGWQQKRNVGHHKTRKKKN